MSLPTIAVAANAQLLRGLKLQRDTPLKGSQRDTHMVAYGVV
jgi:hypothetical protein